MTARGLELLLKFGGFDVECGAETKLINMKESDIGRGDSPDKLNRAVTVEGLKEKRRKSESWIINLKI